MDNTQIKTTWDLKRYYYDGLNDPKFIQDKKDITEQVKKFVEKYKGKIQNFSTPQEILEYYQDDEKISVLASTVGYYIFYRNSLNAQDQEVLKQQTEYHIMMTNLANQLLFVDQEFKILGYDKLIQFSNMPELASHKNALVYKANTLKYILEEKQEFVLNKKSPTINQISDLYDEYHNSLMFEVEIDGEIKRLTEMEVSALRTDANEEIRKQAQMALRKVYNAKPNQIILGNIYSGIVKNWVSNVEIRGYKNVMEPRNISEELDNEVVDMLMKSVHEAYPLFQRYINIKKKFMKKDQFDVWNLMAPIGTISTKVSFEEAINMHLDAMKNFDEEIYNFNLDMIQNGRIDVFPYEGKMGGAYCAGGKDQPVFVLLNFAGKINDVNTISHELGHAFHDEIRQVQPGAVFETPLSLAETASIFNELILTDYLKAKLTPEEKVEFLNDQIGDAFASIFRQIQYITFEKIIHEKTLNGEGLTYQDYNTIWRETQVQMSGDSIVYDVPAEEEALWSRIPHIFHTPFYCYAYSFGNILSFALYGSYKEKGKEFISNYKEILKAGGSMKPKDLLAKYGYDITSPEFYKLGIKEIEKMIDEFESLL